ncbi:hypothetical protein F511_00983 [Dorcoceras hygrometricum]|uniref:Uncharacterized protein n=1 Tax=Dorcoceras hygrometricum TaxID=472368 RepID=A0A2Z7AER2_9LAMI|nr:hypothetical protein F511_00983 [Dorcoceras hygrometricum]
MAVASSNLKNALIAVSAPLPSILFYISFLRQSNSVSPLYIWCYHHPLLLAFVLFFLNISLLFWVVGLLQNSHWMIDLYWTAIPVMLVYYFASHPLAESDFWRSRLVIFLTSVWCIRLSHSYFRRERWQFGAREDWRFTDMKQQYGQNWWWASLFSIYLSQQVFLLGNCLPLYVVHSKNKQLNIWDLVAASVCVAGVTIAYFADTQLHDFVIRNDRMKQLGQPLAPVLDEGLWRYSRHPNYFGEQLWWWGLTIFAWNLGCGWTFFGPLMNSLCLAYVTILVEQRMAKQQYRAEAYIRYQKETSVWIPWFKKSLARKEKEI